MTCRDFAEFLLEYLSGELAADVSARFEEHLRACPNCRVYLGTYAETTRVGRLAYRDDAPLPEDVPEDLVRAIVAARQRR